MKLEEILASTPINKMASVVTSQAGCEDNFLLTDDREKKEALIRQKIIIENKIADLKKKMGMRKTGSSTGSARKFPKHIIDHKKYPKYLELIEKVRELNKEIILLKTESKQGRARKFEEYFVSIMKQKHPAIYEKVKLEVQESLDKLEKTEKD